MGKDPSRVLRPFEIIGRIIFANLLKTGGLSQALQAPLDPGPETGSGPMLGEDERRKTLDPTISS